MKRVFCAIMAIGVLLGGRAEAAEAEALARQAAANLKAGKPIEAIDAVRAAVLAIWDQSPMFVRRALFVEKKAYGYGIFNPRPNNVFKPGEKLLVYAEPVGFTWRKEKGVFRSLVMADFNLRLAAGKLIHQQKDFGRFAFTSYAPLTEYKADLSFALSGLGAGKYILGIILRDTIGAKKVGFDLPFEIR